jgi:hypothetical protein
MSTDAQQLDRRLSRRRWRDERELPMPYLVQTAVLPSVPTTPAGTVSPQLQQFANQLTADLNAAEQQGFHLEEVVETGPAALLIFRK